MAERPYLFVLFYVFAYIVCLYYTLPISQRLCGLSTIAIDNAIGKYTNSGTKKAGSEETSVRKGSLGLKKG